MDIILGASGQVGSGIVNHLMEKGASVKAIIRDEKKAPQLEKTGAKVAIADANDLPALVAAFQDGSTLFALTPESGHERNVIGETTDILENYRKALAHSPIKKVVGLSSIGAQYESGTGNLVMSYLLEHAFTAMPVKQIFVRPAYYFSNWMMYLETVKETGVLPTFFPVDLSIPMVSPEEVAAFVANVIQKEDEDGKIFELTGPSTYSSNDVAKAFSEALGKEVKAVQTPREEWESTLRGIGFSPDAIRNFVEMTQAVIAGKAVPEKNGTVQVELKTTLSEYIKQHVPLQIAIPPVAKTKTRKRTTTKKAAA
ncbi:NmrA family NAD(P)-binding protein [Chitinophaga rhizophila]|uniref:NmrA family NAD(P)-binding protein n=1 Tax=Chitinophaga rhizophila TaxID=2866212 RepID=A0ABS7GB98_9BACT|nr:NmrA family NAD(P)-binding protein [Chitinophaga rhizophila]MBW8684941.1 NmrA family NAD(P)-binding protein [Chitinophaga rhizophila]